MLERRFNRIYGNSTFPGGDEPIERLGVPDAVQGKIRTQHIERLRIGFHGIDRTLVAYHLRHRYGKGADVCTNVDYRITLVQKGAHQRDLTFAVLAVQFQALADERTRRQWPGIKHPTVATALE